jgi:hypothetical protein
MKFSKVLIFYENLDFFFLNVQPETRFHFQSTNQIAKKIKIFKISKFQKKSKISYKISKFQKFQKISKFNLKKKNLNFHKISTRLLNLY